jgi:hypothetical protein
MFSYTVVFRSDNFPQIRPISTKCPKKPILAEIRPIFHVFDFFYIFGQKNHLKSFFKNSKRNHKFSEKV